MRAALINVSTNVVENIIMADPETDAAPEGYVLIALPDWVNISPGTSWNISILVKPQEETS